jgi:hypothetical protein
VKPRFARNERDERVKPGFARNERGERVKPGFARNERDERVNPLLEKRQAPSPLAALAERGFNFYDGQPRTAGAAHTIR